MSCLSQGLPLCRTFEELPHVKQTKVPLFLVIFKLLDSLAESAQLYEDEVQGVGHWFSRKLRTSVASAQLLPKWDFAACGSRDFDNIEIPWLDGVVRQSGCVAGGLADCWEAVSENPPRHYGVVDVRAPCLQVALGHFGKTHFGEPARLLEWAG